MKNILLCRIASSRHLFYNKAYESESGETGIMSKIICRCGNILPDITDNLSYKGYIVSDKELFKMYDFVDELIETDSCQKESLMMTFRKNVCIGKKYIRLKEIYQCPQCGRILIENTPGEYSFFCPEGNSKRNLLDYGGEENAEMLL